MAKNKKQIDTAKYNYGVECARDKLYTNPTTAEKRILDILKYNPKSHIEFQEIIKIKKGLSYIADFLDTDTNTIIEIDGGYHSTGKQRKLDEERTKYLNKKGYKVVRTTNKKIMLYDFPDELGITYDMIRKYKRKLERIEAFKKVS
jgi:very-short-patch-repair endonuclease